MEKNMEETALAQAQDISSTTHQQHAHKPRKGGLITMPFIIGMLIHMMSFLSKM